MSPASGAGLRIGQYVLHGAIASGGMATVHLATRAGDAGVKRVVAIKRIHPSCASDVRLAAMFRDEARLAARVHHPRVVRILDVVVQQDEACLVMEYLLGESLAGLQARARERKQAVPPDIACAIVVGVLEGLQAAHEAVDDDGTPLQIVHRDVSPRNIMVGSDGLPRLVDFGIANAVGRAHFTRRGQVRGSLMYMAPEQVGGDLVDGRTDLFAASAVLWEALVGRPVFEARDEEGVMRNILEEDIPYARTLDSSIPESLSLVVAQGLSRDPEDRFQTAQAMAEAIAAACPLAPPGRVGAWVKELAGDLLAERSAAVAELEKESGDGPVPGGRAAAPLADDGLERAWAQAAKRRQHLRWAIPAGVLLVSAGAALLLFTETCSTTGDSTAGAGVQVDNHHRDALLTASPSLPEGSGDTAPPALPTSGSAARAAGSAAASGQRATPAMPGKASRSNCEPPYTIDAEGLRVPKPECL